MTGTGEVRNLVTHYRMLQEGLQAVDCRKVSPMSVRNASSLALLVCNQAHNHAETSLVVARPPSPPTETKKTCLQQSCPKRGPWGPGSQ